MFVKRRGIFLTIALVLVLASIASLVFIGFNLDTDFAGGMAVTYQIDSEFSVADVESIVNEALGSNQSPSSVQKSGNEVIIKFGFDNSLETDEARSDFAMGKISAITEALTVAYGTEAPAEEAAQGEATEGENAEATEAEEVSVTGVTLKNQDIVSPSTGRELARSAVLMSILACVAILLYVTFRFEFTSGCVAVLALVHDVVLLLGIYSVFRISVDTNFIAAVLTVLGYSINNTIVIMDRIRENTRHARKETYGEIANKSIAQTLSRSINTTITTLLTIGMVYLLGVPSIQAFSMPIIIGIVVGFYSSVFVAGPLWSMWRDSGVKNKK
jgi:preprotein translocase SecF subunit